MWSEPRTNYRVWALAALTTAGLLAFGEWITSPQKCLLDSAARLLRGVGRPADPAVLLMAGSVRLIVSAAIGWFVQDQLDGVVRLFRGPKTTQADDYDDSPT